MSSLSEGMTHAFAEARPNQHAHATEPGIPSRAALRARIRLTRGVIEVLEAAGIRCAAVHGPNIVEPLARGGDVDLLVEDSRRAIAAVRASSLCPARVQARSFVTGLYFWNPESGGFHVDLVHNLGWRGVPFLDTTSALRRSEYSEGIPALAVADRAVAELLLSLLWGGFVKNRYWLGIQDACREGLLWDPLLGTFGPRAAERLLNAIKQGDRV